ncbi:MAG: hypothetical protein L0Z62_45405 [Gemmataceae bacterium]|nr:hypothetical protein [Gemmataceae bacterium]
MSQDLPLWHKLYFDPVYTEVARVIGYAGCCYRDLYGRLEPLYQRFGKEPVEAAVYGLVTYEGQMTCNPKPLAEVRLRPEARKLCWQLLGPPPGAVPLGPPAGALPLTPDQPPATPSHPGEAKARQSEAKAKRRRAKA